jgi:hypothetical protein
MKKRRKNPHAVALGRLGGLVRSEANPKTSWEIEKSFISAGDSEFQERAVLGMTPEKRHPTL